MLRRGLALWWFLSVTSNGWGGTVATVGPFATQAECDTMRAWVQARGVMPLNGVPPALSWCWYAP
jgi:hypothetical protein